MMQHQRLLNEYAVLRDETPVRATIPMSQLIVVTSDDGGYKSGRCVVCQASGWLGRINRTAECALYRAAKDKHPGTK